MKYIITGLCCFALGIVGCFFYFVWRFKDVYR